MAGLKTSITINSNKLPAIKRRYPQIAKDVVQTVVFYLVQIADPITPVDTGNMKNNKTIGPDFVTWHAPYTGFVNYGTRYMAARPFIDTAVAQVKPMFIDAMKALEGAA